MEIVNLPEKEFRIMIVKMVQDQDLGKRMEKMQEIFTKDLEELKNTLESKGLSRVFNTTVQKHQFFDAQPSLWSNSHICTGLLEKP